MGLECPWLDIEGSPCVLGPAGPGPCPVRHARRADGHHLGSAGGAEMGDRLCLPLRPHRHLCLPQRSTGPLPHGSRDAQMPTLLRPGKFPIVTREGLSASASASPGPGAGPSRQADPVTFPRPPQCAQPLAPPSSGTQKGDEAGPVWLMTRTFLASSGRTGAR